VLAIGGKYHVPVGLKEADQVRRCLRKGGVRSTLVINPLEQTAYCELWPDADPVRAQAVLDGLAAKGRPAPAADAREPAAPGSLVLPLEQFDLEAFLDSYWQAQKGWGGDPPLVVDRQAGPLATLDAGPDEWADELLERGHALFLPAHEQAADDPLCVAGCRHNGDSLSLGLLEGYGYLVEVAAGVVSIRPALYDAGAGAVEPRSPCASLAGCMAAFLGPFVRRP
jgi:hypothetical protein